MRTTLDLNDTLLTRAKVAAAQQGTSLTRLIERGLALVLDQPEESQPAAPFRWQVFGDPYARLDAAEYVRRVAEAEAEDDRRQAGVPHATGPADA